MTILLGAVILFVFGFLWYGPVFGKHWVKMIGMTDAQIAEGKRKGMSHMIPQMVIAFVLCLISASVLKYLIPNTGIDFSAFLKSITLIWFGFVLPLHMNGYLWEKKSLKLTMFNCAESILGFIVLAGVVYFW